jgi:hypothetical protein
MENFGGRNFLGRILFEMIFVFVEREHPTENLVKIHLVFSFSKK